MRRPRCTAGRGWAACFASTRVNLRCKRHDQARRRICVPLRLARNYQQLFEQELIGWYADPDLWPRDRSLKLLQQWCAFELHSVVIEAGASAIEDDEVEG